MTWPRCRWITNPSSAGKELDEPVTIQERRIRLATVDLMPPTMSIRQRLRSLVAGLLIDRTWTSPDGGTCKDLSLEGSVVSVRSEGGSGWAARQ